MKDFGKGSWALGARRRASGAWFWESLGIAVSGFAVLGLGESFIFLHPLISLVILRRTSSSSG